MTVTPLEQTRPEVLQFAVSSESVEGKHYIVSFDFTAEGMDCDCPAFAFYDWRGLCKHCLEVIRYAAAESEKKRSRKRSNAPAPTSRMEAASV